MLRELHAEPEIRMDVTEDEAAYHVKAEIPGVRKEDINVAIELVTTTDIHTPRRIGAALERAYQGELDTEYGDEEYSVRVTWHR